MRDPGALSPDGASPHPGRRRVVRDAERRRVVRGAERRPGTGDRPWRVTVEEGSMAPAVEPGDWLLVDPTVRRWPRRGSIVVFREPFTEVLAIKRVAARPGDWVPFADAWLQLGEDEAWLVGDATDGALAAAGFGAAADSRRYGPVTIDALRGRAWFRYGPAGRIGRLAAAPPGLLARSRSRVISPDREPGERG